MAQMNGTSNIFEIRENFIFPGEREIFETKMNNDFAPTPEKISQ